MRNKEFDEYLTLFENSIIVAGVEIGMLGKSELVPSREGKLSRTPFGRKIGMRVENDFPLSIDYYGHMKKTTGFYEMLKEVGEAQVRMVECIVVHFASIKIEQIVEIQSDMVAGFPVFKKQMLRERGFKK